MLKRKSTVDMEEWLHAPSPKALLVKGARQVGKSYLTAQFAREHFDHVVSFDLIEDGRARDSFSKATSADDLLFRMSVASPDPLVPGKTVVVIDEIQECPNLLTYIKYLVQQGDYRYILTGSLLGIQLENIDSLPVGYVTQIEMHPLDFEEFCWANGLPETVLVHARESLAHEQPLKDFVYDRLLDLYHLYLMVGGMPDAVNAFVETGNIDAVRTIHRDLHAL